MDMLWSVSSICLVAESRIAEVGRRMSTDSQVSVPSVTSGFVVSTKTSMLLPFLRML